MKIVSRIFLYHNQTHFSYLTAINSKANTMTKPFILFVILHTMHTFQVTNYKIYQLKMEKKQEKKCWIGLQSCKVCNGTWTFKKKHNNSPFRLSIFFCVEQMKKKNKTKKYSYRMNVLTIANQWSILFMWNEKAGRQIYRIIIKWHYGKYILIHILMCYAMGFC